MGNQNRSAELAGCRCDQEGRIREDVADGEVGEAHNTSLNDGQSHWLVAPANKVGERCALMSPDDGLDQLLPVAAPGDQEHESSRPDEVAEQEHPGPDGKVIAAEGVVTVDQLGGVQPQVIAEPAHQIGAGLIELSHIALPDGQMLPMPVEGDPTDCVQSPEDGQIEGVPGGDVTGATTAGTVAGEGITEVLLVRHQLGTTGIQSAFDQDQSGRVQTQSDGMVNHEVTRSDRQEHVGAAVDGIHPAAHVGGVGIGGSTSGIGKQHVETVDRLTRSSLNELGKNGLNQNLLLGGSERHNDIVVNVKTKRMEAKEEGDPAEVADDRLLVLQHPSQNIVLVGFGVVITDEEDRSVSKGTAHQEDGDVLVVCVQSSLCRVGLGNEGIRRHRVHVLSHQRGDHTERGKGQAELHVQAVVQGVVKTLVTGAEIAWGALWRIVSFENFLDGMTDTKVGPVHVTSDHKQATDRQVVVSDVGEPEGFGLGMETAKEGENRSTGAFGSTEDLTRSIGILCIHTPVAGEEGSKTGGVRHHTQEVVPTNVLTP